MARKECKSVEKVFREKAVSGSKNVRPELDMMFEFIKDRNIGSVIIYSLDRIGRSVRIISEIINKLLGLNCSLISCQQSIDTSSIYGRFCASVFAGLTELERETIKEKTYAGRIERKKLDGENGGRLPFGYIRVMDKETKRNKIQIHPKQSEAVRIIFDLTDKDMFPIDIAKHLNDLGYKTSTGKDWYAKAVRYVKNNKDKYSGGYRSCSSVRWPCIINGF